MEKPIILLAFADGNRRGSGGGSLSNLMSELQGIKSAMEQAQKRGWCELITLEAAQPKDVTAKLSEPDVVNRLAVFHYAGHANGFGLLFETDIPGIKGRENNAEGFAKFMGCMNAIKLVVLNGCSTATQVKRLHKEGVPAVIATSQNINDHAAAKFASTFYTALGKGQNIRVAFKMADAGGDIHHQGSETRGFYIPKHENDDRPPWSLEVKTGSRTVLKWNLPDAVNDPLGNLPPLNIPDERLPAEPYRFLKHYDFNSAPLFHGRGSAIKALYDWVAGNTGSNVLFYTGQSGVGKSSVLAAGLQPRIQHSHHVRYYRRSATSGLCECLAQAIGVRQGKQISQTEPLLNQIKATEKQVLIIIDQAEGALIQPTQPDEAKQFANLLNKLLESETIKKSVKFILSFRMEYYLPMEEIFHEASLPFNHEYLKPLSLLEMRQIILGLAKHEQTRQKYKLSPVPDELADRIVMDLTKGNSNNEAVYAPTLQIILSEMWQKAKKNRTGKAHEFNMELYERVKNKSISAFLQNQMETMGKAHQSGLVLDILHFHTTKYDTAGQCSMEALKTRYQQIRSVELEALIARLVDAYLLIYVKSEGSDEEKGGNKSSTRLAHDQLALPIKIEYNEAQFPGQKAERILDNLKQINANRPENTVSLLDDNELDTIDAGINGMYHWQNDERLLDWVKKSRIKRENVRKRKRLFHIFGILLFVVILFFGRDLISVNIGWVIMLAVGMFLFEK